MSGRIRSIKPEWLEDELIIGASEAARILSVAVLLLADDHGNGRAGITALATVFPCSDPSYGQAALDELVRIRYLSLYVVNNQRYFSIRNWKKHQRVDKPGAPRVPGPDAGVVIEEKEQLRTGYFIRGVVTGLIKIGESFDPVRRLAELARQGSEALELLAVGGVESEHHKLFASDRVHGEWFRPSAAIMKRIAELNNKETPLATAGYEGARISVAKIRENSRGNSASSRLIPTPTPIPTSYPDPDPDLVREEASREYDARPITLEPEPPKAPTPIAQIRRAFLDGYAARYPKDAKAYPWGSRENGQAKNWLKSVPLDEALELVRVWFLWPRADVVKAGHPFCTGGTALVMKYHELRADLSHPERRAFAAIAHDREKQHDHNATTEDQAARVAAMVIAKHANRQDPRTVREAHDAPRSLLPQNQRQGVVAVDGKALALYRPGPGSGARRGDHSAPDADAWRSNPDDTGGGSEVEPTEDEGT